jgi:hypothetical protein
MKKHRILLTMAALAGISVIATASTVPIYGIHDIGDGDPRRSTTIDNGFGDQGGGITQMNSGIASGIGHDMGGYDGDAKDSPQHGGGSGGITMNGGGSGCSPAGAVGKDDLDPLYGAGKDVSPISLASST